MLMHMVLHGNFPPNFYILFFHKTDGGQLLRKFWRKQFLPRFCKSLPGLSIRHFPSHQRCFPSSCWKSFSTCREIFASVRREIFPRVAEKYLLAFAEKYWCLLGEKYLSACPPPSPRPLAAFLPHSASLYYHSSSILRQAPRSSVRAKFLIAHKAFVKEAFQHLMIPCTAGHKDLPFVIFSCSNQKPSSGFLKESRLKKYFIQSA